MRILLVLAALLLSAPQGAIARAHSGPDSEMELRWGDPIPVPPPADGGGEEAERSTETAPPPEEDRRAERHALAPPSVPVVEVPVPGDRRIRLLALPGAAEGIAKDLAGTLGEDRQRVERILGSDDPKPIEIRVAYGKDGFVSLQPDGYRVPGWAAGVAFSGLGLIVIDGQASGRGGSVRAVTIHELAHIALGRAAKGRVPRWFNEGFALHAAGEWSLGRSAVVGRAALAKALIPLSDLDHDWPHSVTDVNLAYAQSASMVGHLISVERGDALRRMIHRLADGLPFDEAILAAYGKPLIVLEVEWKKDLTTKYGWLPVLLDNELLWTSAAIILAFGAWRSRRRTKRRLAQMEDDPNSPIPEAVWNPDYVEPPSPLGEEDDEEPRETPNSG